MDQRSLEGYVDLPRSDPARSVAAPSLGDSLKASDARPVTSLSKPVSRNSAEKPPVECAKSLYRAILAWVVALGLAGSVAWTVL